MPTEPLNEDARQMTDTAVEEESVTGMLLETVLVALFTVIAVLFVSSLAVVTGLA